MVSRPLPTTRFVVGAVLTVAMAATLAACSGSGSDDAGDTTATTTTTVLRPAPSDGQLTIGMMRPPSSSLLRESLSLATEQAVEKINQAGGSFGGEVELVTADEGDTVSSARDAVEELLDHDVDAIIGPMSSVNALGTLGAITSAGVIACSPTASALALDAFPDGGLFFRTIPSDSMQAEAIVEVAEQTGVQSVAIVYVDDAYGRPFSEAVAAGLETLSIDVVDRVGFASADSELDDEVARVLDSSAGVLILLADANDSMRFLESLSDADDEQITNVIVNDALRSAGSSQRLAGLRPIVREAIRGVAPQAESEEAAAPFDPPGPFATNAFDCVTLIALAAQLAQSDSAGAIASGMSTISNGGSECRNYADCVTALNRTLEIDYNGASDLTDIGSSSGAPTHSWFDVFMIDETGNDLFAYKFIAGS